MKALIIDSWFDSYVGVVSLVRVFDGTLKVKQKMRVMSSGDEHLITKLGIFTPKAQDRSELRAGEVGFVIAGIKDINGAPVGDTLTDAARPTANACPDSRKCSRASSPGCFRWNRTTTKTCAKRSPNCA